MSEEVLVFNVGDSNTSMKVGKSYLLLGVAESEAAARRLVENLPATAGSKVVIVQRKALVLRIPAVRLEDLDDPVAE